MGKEINAILGAQTILIWTYVKGYARMSSNVWGIPDMSDIVFGKQWMLRPGLCSKKNWGLGFCIWSLLCGVVPETSSIMRVLERAPVSVISTLLNESERSLNKKWLRPVTNKSNPPLIGNQSETPSNFQFKLFYFIYPHKETYIVIRIIKSENIACIVPHENLLLFWYPSWIFWRNTYRLES